MKKTISVFGSSRPTQGDPEYLEAFEVGRALARAGFSVCNGGYGGTMEASARGAKEAGGETVGITVDTFPRTPNRWIDREIRTSSLPQRIALLVDSADGYVVLKGGTGTLLEFAYVWEFMNKRVIAEKPIIIIGNFWEKVVETLREELLWEGIGDCTRFVQNVRTPEECAALLKQRLR